MSRSRSAVWGLAALVALVGSTGAAAAQAPQDEAATAEVPEPPRSEAGDEAAAGDAAVGDEAAVRDEAADGDADGDEAADDEAGAGDEAVATPAEAAAAQEDVRVSAELGRGVEITTGDAFALQLRARIQFQGALAHATQDAIDAGADEHWALEFQIRRMRLALQGHVLTRDIRYYIQLGFSPRDMERDLLVPVRDAQITWQAHRDIGIRVGQMKVPYGLQRIVSSSALQFVDRSIVVAELNLDRDIGVTLVSDDFLGLRGMFQYHVGLFGGRGRNRFGGLDSALLAGQIRVNPFGAFDHLSESDQRRSLDPRLSLGASAGYNIDSNRARSTHENVLEVARFDFLHLGADMHFKWAGFSALAEVMYREAGQTSFTGVVGGEEITEYSRSGWGWFAQAGYLLPVLPVELAVRYGEIRPLSQNDPAARFFEQHELGGALSYYVEEHALKVQLDYFYYFGDDPRAERHQVRMQAQLFF